MTRSLDINADHELAMGINKDFNYRCCTSLELKRGFEQGLPIDASDRAWFGFNGTMSPAEQWEACKYIELQLVDAMVRLYMEMWMDEDDDSQLVEEYINRAYPYHWDLHELDDRTMEAADYWFQHQVGTLGEFLESALVTKWVAKDLIAMFDNWAGLDSDEILGTVFPAVALPFGDYVGLETPS